MSVDIEELWKKWDATRDGIHYCSKCNKFLSKYYTGEVCEYCITKVLEGNK
jgi:hypothetical protein